MSGGVEKCQAKKEKSRKKGRIKGYLHLCPQALAFQRKENYANKNIHTYGGK